MGLTVDHKKDKRVSHTSPTPNVRSMCHYIVESLPLPCMAFLDLVAMNLQDPTKLLTSSVVRCFHNLYYHLSTIDPKYIYIFKRGDRGGALSGIFPMGWDCPPRHVGAM